jgi:hypothetical protein
MRALQKELDDLRRDKERDSRRAREDAELVMLRERCERLENERGASGGPGGYVRVLFFRPLPVSILIVHFFDQLRSDMEGLLTELSGLSRRNDELMTATDSDLVVIRDLDVQLKEHRA